MGNNTNPSQWAALERLRFIERSAWWRGMVNRNDLQQVYGVSQAQASADLQKYLELNPTALNYSLKRKRYEGTPTMKCVLHRPQLEEALGQFLEPASSGGAGGWGGSLLGGALESPASEPTSHAGMRVAGVGLPQRTALPAVHRAIFLATLQELRVRIHYLSLTQRRPGWRWITPHAFAHDGYRWHVRAWCEENKAYRDFVLGRIKETEWPTLPAGRLEPDAEWHSWLTLDLMPNPALSKEQQEAVKADYDLKSGRMSLQVRQAMLEYTLAHLRLPAQNGKKPAPFLVLHDKEPGQNH